MEQLRPEGPSFWRRTSKDCARRRERPDGEEVIVVGAGDVVGASPPRSVRRSTMNPTIEVLCLHSGST